MSDSPVRSVPRPVSSAGEEAAKVAMYRPLSLIALCGVGLSGLFAAVVVLGGLIAFFHGDPLLLTGWLALFSAGFPIAGAALSYLALARIQRSEGTLAGEKLARWGLVLSALVGLSYWAYVLATYVAISQEAGKFAETYLNELKNGQNPPLSAFRLVLPPEQRPPEGATNLRQQIEARFNGGESGPGRLTAFSQTEYIRLIGMGGSETQIEPLGVADWSYAGGGYQVGLLYRITTPFMSFPLAVTVVGVNSKRAEGRDWHVVWDKTTMRGTPTPSMTDEGKRMMPASMLAREKFLRTWEDLLREGRGWDAFLQTQPLPERGPMQKLAEQRMLGLSLLNALAPPDAPALVASRTLLAVNSHLDLVLAEPRFGDFLNGALVRAEAPVFWAPDDIRDDLVRLFREAFRTSLRNLPSMMSLEMHVHVVRSRTEGDRFVVEHDFTGQLPAGRPRYSVEGRIIVDCDLAEVKNDPSTVKSWRVRSVELISGKSLPLVQPGKPGARRPMGL